MKTIKETITKEQTWYLADDGSKFSSEEHAKEHNETEYLRLCHKKLSNIKFFSRFNIPEYFHNSSIKTLRDDTDFDEDYNGFRLVGGRMGNGDDYVSFKIDGEYVKFIKTNSYGDVEDEYLGKISKDILNLTGEELVLSTDNYLEKRNIKHVDRIKSRIDAKNNALSKLTDEEKKLLNIIS